MEILAVEIKAVLFDMDGTLVDTEFIHWQAWVEILRPYGIELPPEGYAEFGGKAAPIIEQEMMAKYNIKARKGEISDAKEVLAFEWIKTRDIPLMPYAVEAIGFFKKRNIITALSSGAPRHEVDVKLQKADLLKYFETIVTRSDVKNGKPNPDIYNLTLERLGISNSECVALEDTQFGVQSGKDAGIYTIAIPNKYTKLQDFKIADAVVSNLKEATTHIQKQFDIAKV